MADGVFAICRTESYKMSDVGGICKEASRQLPNYPNSDIDFDLTSSNVILEGLWERDCTPEQFITRYRENNNIAGRFNVKPTTNSKSQTNVLCQSLFSFSAPFLANKSRDEIVEIYKACLDFMKKLYPTAVIMDAVIHFDEPGSVPHMQCNWLPIAERKNKKSGNLEKVFSTTILMPGKDYYGKFQDLWYDFACEKFDFEFDRRSDDEPPRPHLSLPEYKEATKELNVLNEKIAILRDVAMDFDTIDQIGTPRLLSSAFSVEADDLEMLKVQAKQAALLARKVDIIERERADFLATLDRERERNAFLLDELKDLQRKFRNAQDVFALIRRNSRGWREDVCYAHMSIDVQKRLDEVFGTDYAQQEIIRLHNKKLGRDR